MKAYFCDPHSPWQKGGVENLNGRARRFLPRESPPEALARAHLRRLADRLNDTPAALPRLPHPARGLPSSTWRPRPARPNLTPAPVALRVETAR